MSGIKGHWHPLMRPSRAELKDISIMGGIEGHWHPLMRPSRAELNAFRQSQPHLTEATLEKATVSKLLNSAIKPAFPVDSKGHSIDSSPINELHSQSVSDVADHHVQVTEEEFNSSRDFSKLASTDLASIEAISRSLSKEKSSEITEAGTYETGTSFAPVIEEPQHLQGPGTHSGLKTPDLLSDTILSVSHKNEIVDTFPQPEKVSVSQSDKETISDLDTHDNSIPTIDRDPNTAIFKMIEQKSDHSAQTIQIASNHDLNPPHRTDQNAFISAFDNKDQVPHVSSSENHLNSLSAEGNDDQVATHEYIHSIKDGSHSANLDNAVPEASPSIGMLSKCHLFSLLLTY